MVPVDEKENAKKAFNMTLDYLGKFCSIVDHQGQLTKFVEETKQQLETTKPKMIQSSKTKKQMKRKSISLQEQLSQAQSQRRFISKELYFDAFEKFKCAIILFSRLQSDIVKNESNFVNFIDFIYSNFFLLVNHVNTFVPPAFDLVNQVREPFFNQADFIFFHESMRNRLGGAEIYKSLNNNWKTPIENMDSDSLRKIKPYVPTFRQTSFFNPFQPEVKIPLSFLQRPQQSDSSNVDSGKISEHLTCTICCEVFSDPYIMSPCNHTFDKGCINEWLKNNDTCPQCRTKVTNSSANHLVKGIIDAL